MAIFVLQKIDRLLNALIILFIIGGSMVVHTLTALAIKSYYGDPWGYLAFLAPLLAEAYLVLIQLGDNMYNYTIIISSFICMASLAALVWLLKNIVLTRVNGSLKH